AGKTKKESKNITEEIQLSQKRQKLYASLAAYKTEHFIVRSRNKETSLQTAQFLEGILNRFSKELGVAKNIKWETPCTVTIFPDRNSFLPFARGRDWSGGSAIHVMEIQPNGVISVLERRIQTFEMPEQQLFQTLSHETAHMIFRELLGPQSQIPLWVDEGIALYLQGQNQQNISKALINEMAKGKILPLRILLAVKEYPPVENLFYLESSSLMDFLINNYGMEKFIELAWNLSIGKPADRTISSVYKEIFENAEGLETAWLQFIRKK
ncbi:MAG: peptidase MA family metallohydrolase, partial [Candidatus Theseobacter exili]|nr:peptidase MA family metallohydrolase [Candidatus Theseobacter exili]